MKSMITVAFKGDQSGLCEDLYYCEETEKVYIRQESDADHVRWLTASKWSGGYEADCPMKAGLFVQVIDSAGNNLFEEKLIHEEGVTGTWALKRGPFSWEAITASAEEYKRALGLKTYEAWKAWLMADAESCGFMGCSDNWLFAMAERGPLKKISQLSYLGVTAYVTVQEEKHTVCGKKWSCYELKDASLETTLAICGYKFENGG